MTITIYSKELYTKDGRRFYVFTTHTKNGACFNVKFTRASNVAINQKGFFDLDVPEEALSLQKTKAQEDGRKFPDIIWINQVKSITPNTTRTLELRKQELEELKELF